VSPESAGDLPHLSSESERQLRVLGPARRQAQQGRSPFYYYTARFMEILLAGVFAFFSIHTVFWFYRSLRVRLAGGSDKGKDNHSAENDR
jgi:hypothetical protein